MRLERFLDGHFGIDAMQLPQGQGFQLQTAQAHFDLLLQVFGASDREPLVRTLAGEPGFGGDNEAFRVGSKRFTDQAFAHFWSIGVGGVDEVDAQFHGAAEHLAAGVGIFGLAPDAGSRDAHGAKTKPVDGEVAAEGEGVCMFHHTFGMTPRRQWTQKGSGKAQETRSRKVGQLSEREAMTASRSAISSRRLERSSAVRGSPDLS